MRRLLPQSAYARNVITLMTGTGLAQAIPIAVSPILTRIYSPEQFGLFALFMAIASIAAVLVTGRYEQAILLPKEDRDAMQVVALSTLLSILLSFTLFVLVCFFNAPIAELLGNPAVAPWLYWIPLSTLLMGGYQSLSYWCNRKGQYKRLAVSRTLQSGCSSGGQLAGGALAAGVTGLVWGQLIGQLLALLALARMVLREDRSFVRGVSLGQMAAWAKKYINFPKFLIAAHGFNTASSQMPIMLLSVMFNASSVGFYNLTQRVLGAPITLVAGALGDVFRQEASRAYIDTGNCKLVYVKTLKRLLIVSILPFFAFFLMAPVFFALVFGEPWRVAGEYARILVPMFFLRFVASPLSMVFIVAEAQKLDLAWQVMLFVLVVVAFLAGYWLGSEWLALVFFTIAYSFCFLVNLLISYRLACGGFNLQGVRSA
ncbi:oligosaccharide flippase family protein [Pseudomonas mosselii]|uniref:oligosaccharide flippase family protein n=1 Tax=Pseudomonas mosselii TaxID=78327 RepID=UPI001F4BD634|nr:oligosaccharide flippase family protein [Pseudomonas mosselii]MCH7418391.1 oligosaccharide flippase family protein [Pseudomonas mosselii]